MQQGTRIKAQGTRKTQGSRTKSQARTKTGRLFLNFESYKCGQSGGEKNKLIGKKTILPKPYFFHLAMDMSKELEDRFLEFGRRLRDFCKRLKRDVINLEYIKQLIKASGSVGANYIEASDDLGKADEKMKLKIARRESKESKHWLNLVDTCEDGDLEKERIYLLDEAEQIKKILSSIINKLG